MHRKHRDEGTSFHWKIQSCHQTFSLLISKTVDLNSFPKSINKRHCFSEGFLYDWLEKLRPQKTIANNRQEFQVSADLQYMERYTLQTEKWSSKNAPERKEFCNSTAHKKSLDCNLAAVPEYRYSLFYLLVQARARTLVDITLFFNDFLLPSTFWMLLDESCTTFCAWYSSTAFICFKFLGWVFQKLAGIQIFSKLK